jgi:hypothetical protein
MLLYLILILLPPFLPLPFLLLLIYQFLLPLVFLRLPLLA